MPQIDTFLYEAKSELQKNRDLVKSTLLSCSSRLLASLFNTYRHWFVCAQMS